MSDAISRPTMGGLVTRRDFLRVGAAGAVTVTLGSALSGRVLAQSPTAPCVPGGPLNLFTWQGYEGVGVASMDAFYADNGIDLKMRPVGNENLLQMMTAPGHEAWDAFSVNQGDNQYLFSQGIMASITVEEVPGLGRMYPAMADSPVWKVSDGVYNAVPWTLGALGINYIRDRVPEGITSYAQALDPKYRVGTIDSSLNMIATAACAVGLDPAVLTREELQGPVRDWLTQLRPQLRVISTSLGDQLTVLENDDVDMQLVGLLWFVSQGKETGHDVVFVMPDEGTYGFCDSLAITPWATNRCNALALANAYLTPEVVAPLQDSLLQIGPTPEINAMLTPEVRAMYPDDIDKDFFGNLKWNVSHYDPDGAYATIDEWDALWTEVKLAG